MSELIEKLDIDLINLDLLIAQNKLSPLSQETVEIVKRDIKEAIEAISDPSVKRTDEIEPDFYCTSCDWEGFDSDVLCGSCETVSKDINCDDICPECAGDELWDACPVCGSRATTLKELAGKQTSVNCDDVEGKGQ